jgi:hypothetical protein
MDEGDSIMADKPKDDSHPADALLESIKGLFNGDNARKTLRDAYDRVTGQTTPPAPTPKPVDTSWHDVQVKATNKSFLDASQAADIRAKVNKK